MITRESKIFFITLTVIVLFSVVYTYYDSIILRRFDIFVTEEEVPTYTDLWGEVQNLFYSYVQ